MSKAFIVLSIVVAASIIFIALPGIMEHLGQGLHFATIIVSGHHLVDEIVPKKTPQEHL